MAAEATRPVATLEVSARAGSDATPPASWSRYVFQSATCVRYSLFASTWATCDTSSAVGTLRICPVFMRFMLLPMKADLFSRKSATSICSMLTFEGFTWSAILRSVSPFCTGP